MSGRCVDPAPPAGLVHCGVTGSILRYLFPVDPCTEPDRMSGCSPGRTDGPWWMRIGCALASLASGTLGGTLRTPLLANGTDPSVPPWIQASVQHLCLIASPSLFLTTCFAITLVELCLFSAPTSTSSSYEHTQRLLLLFVAGSRVLKGGRRKGTVCTTGPNPRNANDDRHAMQQTVPSHD